MAETLYIRLRADSSGTTEFAVAAAGGRAASLTGSLDAALQLAIGRRVVLFAPLSEVRLSSFEIAARDAQKILQAAPYALEDQLADDVDTLHFAIGGRDSTGRIPVAVVARNTIEQWLAPFIAAGVQPAALYTDLHGLPAADGTQWTALAEPSLVTVRSGSASGFTCAPDALDSYLMLSPTVQSLHLHVSGNDGPDYTRLSKSVELRPGWKHGLDCLIEHLNADQAINLLQGRYSPQRDLQRLWKPWRLAASLAAVWLLLAAAGAGVNAWRDAHELQRLSDANRQRFQTLFPSETRIVDLAVQTEQQLAALKGSDTPSGLFSLLEPAAAALATETSLSLQVLQFRDGALFLSLTGSDLQALERLRENFGTRPSVRLEVQSANSSSLGVQIRLKVTPA